MAQISELGAGTESGSGYASTYTYDPFTRHQFYTRLNHILVETAIGLVCEARSDDAPIRVVELASGTGAVTEEMLDALDRRQRAAEVVGVEPSAAAIQDAEQRLAGRSVSFVQGDAADLQRVGCDLDAVFFCNAIHLVPDKDAAVADIGRVLRSGGFFAANSSFYTGAYAEGSERFYHLWTRRAMGWLRQHHPDVRPSHRGRTTAMQWLSPDEYAAVLRRQGFEVAHMSEETACVPLRGWQDIGRYWLFIEGALPGVPIPLGADALEYGAAQAFEELGLDYVPRNWLQIVARKIEG